MRPSVFDDIHWGAALESRTCAVRFSNSKARITACFLRERKRKTPPETFWGILPAIPRHTPLSSPRIRPPTIPARRRGLSEGATDTHNTRHLGKPLMQAKVGSATAASTDPRTPHRKSPLVFELIDCPASSFS